jgi:ABC-type branched-subunit amino acid transport system substrate-binding protein
MRRLPLGPFLAGLFLFAGALEARAVVRVGVLAPLNGPDAPMGVALTNGVDLALETARRGGLGLPRIQIRDSSLGAAATIRQGLELLRDEEILVGEIWSARTLMLGALALCREAVLLSPVAPREDVARLGPGIFSLAVPRVRQVERLVAYARDSLGVRHPALFYPQDAPGRKLRDLFLEAWPGGGVLSVGYPPGEHDFVDEVQQAFDAGADALVPLGSSRETVSLVSHASQQGFLGPYLGLETLGTAENVHLLQERFCRALYAEDSWDVLLPGTYHPRVFEQTYRQRYGTDADRFARHGYLALWLLVQVASRWGDAPEAIARGLEELRDPLEPEARFLRPPEHVARVRLVLIEGDRQRLLW